MAKSGRYTGKRKLVKAGDFPGDKTFKLGDPLPSESASGGRTKPVKKSSTHTSTKRPKPSSTPSSASPKASATPKTAGTTDSSTKPKIVGADPLTEMGVGEYQPRATVGGYVGAKDSETGGRRASVTKEQAAPRTYSPNRSAPSKPSTPNSIGTDTVKKYFSKVNERTNIKSRPTSGKSPSMPKGSSTVDTGPRVGLFPGMPVKRKTPAKAKGGSSKAMKKEQWVTESKKKYQGMFNFKDRKGYK